MREGHKRDHLGSGPSGPAGLASDIGILSEATDIMRQAIPDQPVYIPNLSTLWAL